MAAANTDKFQKVGIQSATTLDANYTINDGTVTVASTSGWPTDTGITFAMDVIDSAGGQVAGTYNEFVGTVSTATSITNVDYADGTGDRNYTAGATTRVYIPVSKTRENRLVEGMLVEHDQDGTHSAITATSITATTGTFTNLTIAGTASAEGWSALGATPNTVTANGNRSYDLVFNSNDLTDTLSPGMRLKATRTVTAPTQCADLESSSSHYFSKASPAGAAQTDDITVMAWVKLESYNGAKQTIISRANGTTDGWTCYIDTNGTIVFGGMRATDDYVTSYQSVPLNKWTHIAASIDSSGASGLIYIDGVLVPSAYTNNANTGFLTPTADLRIGAGTGGTVPFDGKLAQVAMFSAVISATTIRSYMSQGLTGSETNLVSAYSLSNSLTDLNTGNANNLTAQNSAVATATDTPFAGGSVGTTEYGIVTAATFSTNTTLTVQVPEGYALPTTGGISAVSYSINKIPYGFPINAGKWELSSLGSTSAAVASTTYGLTSHTISVPIGVWEIGYSCSVQVTRGSTSFAQGSVTLTATSTTEDDARMTCDGLTLYGGVTNTHTLYFPASREKLIDPSSATTYYMQLVSQAASISTNLINSNKIYARCAYL